MKFSIIIPVLNESGRINSIIQHIHNIDKADECEVIVVDGSSTKDTIKNIHHKNVVCLSSGKGRARQMNTGAKVAKGDILIFLHADTRMPEDALNKISQILNNGKYVGGAFDLEIDSKNIILKFISYTASIRYRFTKVPYGDQVIFIRKDYFEQIGRYKEIPLMEDVELMQRIKKLKGTIFIIKDKVKTSPRKWIENGIVYNTFKNHIIEMFYFLGVSPEKLAKFYSMQ